MPSGLEGRSPSPVKRWVPGRDYSLLTQHVIPYAGLFDALAGYDYSSNALGIKPAASSSNKDICLNKFSACAYALSRGIAAQAWKPISSIVAMILLMILSVTCEKNQSYMPSQSLVLWIALHGKIISRNWLLAIGGRDEPVTKFAWDVLGAETLMD